MIGGVVGMLVTVSLWAFGPEAVAARQDAWIVIQAHANDVWPRLVLLILCELGADGINLHSTKKVPVAPMSARLFEEVVLCWLPHLHGERSPCKPHVRLKSRNKECIFLRTLTPQNFPRSPPKVPSPPPSLWPRP